jgi:hypothetical protein
VIADVLKRFASTVSIPGAFEVGVMPPKTNARGLPESVSASVTVDAKMFKATLPPLTIDKSGIRFAKPFRIALHFNAEIDIPPIALSDIGGTIGEKSLSLGANATLLQSAIAYVLKAKGDFTLPFDPHDDITAIEQMVAFSVIPLGKSTSRINIQEPMMSRTIEIGGALKPIIWLFGEAKINKERIKGNTNFAVFGADLAKADLNADFRSGLVDATGHADIGIGDLTFVFNGKQFALNPRLQLNGNIHIGSFSLSSFNILAKLDSAAVKFKVLGISLGFVVPSMKNINADMLEKLIEDLISFDLKDLGKAIEAILSGNLTINPFSRFGKDNGNGVSNSDGTGSEGSGEGDDAVGAYPAAGQDLAEQGPQGMRADEATKKAAESEAQITTDSLSEKAVRDGAQPGGSKALLNPEGKLVMQFVQTAENKITGSLASPGQDSTSPLLTMQQGIDPSLYFDAAEPTHLRVVKTPVLLDRDIFVAADASTHLFLEKEPRNDSESPIKGLCTGNVSEVDLLLFGKDGDASQPKRLPAGLLGLCLEGLKDVAKNPVASDLLLGALRVASMTLPGPQAGNGAAAPESTDKVPAPLRSAWFQCTNPKENKQRSGLALLITGELASRIIVKDEDKGLTYFKMTGFPYGDLERIAQACQLLVTAEPADEQHAIDFIEIKDSQGSLSAGRMVRGELKFDKEWVPLGAPGHALPPIFPSKTSPDPLDLAIHNAIDQQNEDNRAPSPDIGPNGDIRMSSPGGNWLCVVNKGNAPFLAEHSSMATFLALDPDVFRFNESNLTFPGFSVSADSCGQVDSDQSVLVIYYKAMPGIGRFAQQRNECALETYWTEGDLKLHAGIKVSDNLCAISTQPAINLRVFYRDMFLVISQLMDCMDLLTANKSSCLKLSGGPLTVGGGWSDDQHIVISATNRPEEVDVWGGPISLNDKRGKPLNGESEELAKLINRGWKGPSIGVFADWINRQTDPGIDLLHLGDNSASFMTTSGVLRLDLNTGQKTEFRFISNAGLKTRKVISKVLDQLTVVPQTNAVTDVALIADNSGLITFAIKQADGKWEAHRPSAAATQIISGLSEPDLTPAFGRAIQ